MDMVLSIIGILALGFLANVVLKQTYNFIFYLGGKPLLWALVAAAVGGLLWFVSAVFNWSVSIPAWAAAIAFFMNLPPRSTPESKAQTNEKYAEMGLKHGALLYRVGLGGFVVSSIVGWVVFYGQSCTSAGQCSGFF
jgi:hypothetical protein